VSCTLVERTSEMQYWEQGEFETDHLAIACKIKLKTSYKGNMVQNKKRKEKVSYKIVGSVTSWKFWDMMSHVCDEKMEQVMDRLEGVRDVERGWSLLKDGIVQVLEVGRRRAKRRRDEEGEELKMMKKELERVKKEMRKWNKHDTKQ